MAIGIAAVVLVVLIGVIGYRHVRHQSATAPRKAPASTHVTETTPMPQGSSDANLVRAANSVTSAYAQIAPDINTLGSIAAQVHSESSTLQQSAQTATAVGFQCSGGVSIQDQAMTVSTSVGTMNGAAQQLQNAVNTLTSLYPELQSAIRSTAIQVPPGTPSYNEVLNAGLSGSSAEASAGEVMAAANQDISEAGAAQSLPVMTCS